MRRFWILMWRLGRRDLRLLWYALRHPARPAWLLPAAALLALFALEPGNLAFLPLGVVDDLVLLPMLLHALLRLLPRSIQADFARSGEGEELARVRRVS
jgi:uncharacterized membrane protein YkvA (DUF1232 family)